MWHLWHHIFLHESAVIEFYITPTAHYIFVRLLVDYHVMLFYGLLQYISYIILLTLADFGCDKLSAEFSSCGKFITTNKSIIKNKCTNAVLKGYCINYRFINIICKEMHLDQYLASCVRLHSDICAQNLPSSHYCSYHCSRPFVAACRRIECS